MSALILTVLDHALGQQRNPNCDARPERSGVRRVACVVRRVTAIRHSVDLLYSPAMAFRVNVRRAQAGCTLTERQTLVPCPLADAENPRLPLGGLAPSISEAARPFVVSYPGDSYLTHYVLAPTAFAFRYSGAVDAGWPGGKRHCRDRK